MALSKPAITGIVVAVVAALALIIVLVVVLAGGKENVNVVVKDEEGAPISSAVVVFDGTGGGVTDAEGLWSESLKQGKHTMVVSAATGGSDPPTYQPARASVEVTEADKPQTFNVVLEGWSAFKPLPAIADAVAGLKTGPQTATVTYSYVPANTVIKGSLLTTSLEEQFTNGMEGPEFIAEIQTGFAQLKGLLESVFRPPYAANPLTVNFVSASGVGVDATEIDGGPALNVDYSETFAATYNVGTIRIAMGAMSSSDSKVLAYAFTPDQAPYAWHSDILFNKIFDWRPDADVEDATDNEGSAGGFSVAAVFLHELMHAIGVGHHAKQSSLMFPQAGLTTSLHTLYSDGTAASSATERAAVRGLFPL